MVNGPPTPIERRKAHMAKDTGTTKGTPANVDTPPAGWVDEQTGFPPYWSPVEGASFRGTVMARDNRDPDFHRYVIRSSTAIECAQGPADEAEPVQVAPGELFSLSTYAALPLDDYMGFEVFVTAKNKRKIQGGKQDLWVFKLMVSPDTKAKVLALRQAKDKENPLLNQKSQGSDGAA